ncbi:hypothetical protein BCV70DRAFT_176782 [Testicularia cyperi]|uniref:DASH complex subunit DUO1 n=1 Tax=Testicularia cyperi TaxID=1882483 RepID=A0A317XNL5_9BASI|nr:hypothetical protein BCV70DRAFT_176782 [Testicularia cyperi]
MPQPVTPKIGNMGDSSWLLDENLSSDLMQNSLHDLNISDSPPARPLRTGTSSNTGASGSGSKVKKPMKARPSWGSAPILDATSSAKAMGKMRLLAGLDSSNDENRPPVSRGAGAGAAGAGGGRPRFSLFAKPGVPTNLVAKKTRQQEEEEDDDDDDDATIHGLTFPDSSQLASSSLADEGTVDGGDDEYIREALLGKRASARQSIGGPTPQESTESQEQMARQLAELRRMNDVFEAMERMLRGSAGQITAFAQRVSETDDLLNIYISLLRQTEKTQQLVQDADWKGTTEDATAHALSIALAERETQRLQAEAQAREEAAQRAAELAARRAEEQQQQRLEEARRAAAGGARGRGRAVSGSSRGGSVRGGPARGGASTTASSRGRTVATSSTASSTLTRGAASTRGAGVTRGRSISGTASSGTGARGGAGVSRPSGIPTRAVSGSAGLGGQYANVKSSGYGPR